MTLRSRVGGASVVVAAGLVLTPALAGASGGVFPTAALAKAQVLRWDKGVVWKHLGCRNGGCIEVGTDPSSKNAFLLATFDGSLVGIGGKVVDNAGARAAGFFFGEITGSATSPFFKAIEKDKDGVYRTTGAGSAHLEVKITSGGTVLAFGIVKPKLYRRIQTLIADVTGA